MKLTRLQINECIVALQFAELWWSEFAQENEIRLTPGPAIKADIMCAPCDAETIVLTCFLKAIEVIISPISIPCQTENLIKFFEELDNGS